MKLLFKNNKATASHAAPPAPEVSLYVKGYSDQPILSSMAMGQVVTLEWSVRAYRLTAEKVKGLTLPGISADQIAKLLSSVHFGQRCQIKSNATSSPDETTAGPDRFRARKRV